MDKNPQFTPWSQSVIYQIYPRSFKDSNSDGIGDIKGIIEKLDYLVELGIDTIWISPLYPSPMKDFGYDITDYCNIDPLFGTLSDFDSLVDEAHKRGIKIMMDFVPNHTSDEHPWFKESKSSKTNPKRDWYIWRDAKLDGSAPNNWLSIFGGSVWEWDKDTEQYYLHTFLKEQPDLNWRNPEVIRAMTDVMRFWLKRGVDGFRVDAVIFAYKDEKFLDEPYKPKEEWDAQRMYYNLEHIYTVSQPELTPLLDMFCNLLEEFADKFMVTETSSRLLNMDQLVYLYTEKKENVHAPFNFYFINLPWDAKTFKDFIDAYDNKVGNIFIPTYVLGNHDKPRVASRIGKDAARTAAMLLLTLRGIPTIYNGEEIGMEDGDIKPEESKDPHRTVVQGVLVSRDPERTPIQWTDEMFAGFSTVAPWLPIHKNYMSINIKKEMLDTTSMWSLYKNLLHLRKQHPALLNGTYKSLPESSEKVLLFKREINEERILVVLNFSHEKVEVVMEEQDATCLLSTYLDIGKEKNDLKNTTLRPYEGRIYKLL